MDKNTGSECLNEWFIDWLAANACQVMMMMMIGITFKTDRMRVSVHSTK